MKRELEAALAACAKELFDVKVAVELTRPEDQFGDYATNVALQLANQLGKKPREIAEALAVKIRDELADTVSDVSVAGPGFINLKLKDIALAEAMNAMPTLSLKDKTVVVEYSDPNPFKVLHAGHLYTTLVGDSIARLFEQAGATVHRLNYGGDVGLHVGKAMWAILKDLGGEDPAKLKLVPENERLEWLSDQYVAGNSAYNEDKSAKNEIIEINKKVYQLHEKDEHKSPFAQIYWTCRQWSYEGFDRLYEQLEVTKFERYIPESESAPIGAETVEQGLSKGVFKKSDGAIIFEGEPHDLHTRVFINSEGLPTYEAKDLGLAAIKWRDYHFDLSVIITANDIVEYMKVVLKAMENFHPEVVERSKHLTHGMIKLPGGVKMSSRLGNILRASDILAQTLLVLEKNDREPNSITMLAAVKYAFLKQRTGGDIVYDPKESVSLEGNSGPYLQYAYARARSILRKAQAKSQKIESLEAGERALARKITEYPEVVDKAVTELMPHHVCTYLYELAQTFNRFYENNRVIGDERQDIRLSLVAKYADTLRNGLDLLGIASPDKM